jgi:chemotaxis protein MotB
MGKVPTIQASGSAAAEKAPFDNMPSPVHTPIITRDAEVKHLPPALRQQVEHQVEKLNEAYEKLTGLLAGMIRKGEVRVSLQSMGVVIDINAVVLFKSGKAELTPGAWLLIEQVAGVLKDLNYRVQVNGFTDNAQIHSAQFSSNWDLSAARAISVVKRFVLDGIDPSLLVGAGYGEYHPVASNDTPEGMAMNRRVSIVVVSPLEGHDPSQTPLLGDTRAASEQAPSEPAQGAGRESGDRPASVSQEPQAPSDGCDGAASNGTPC